MHCLSSVCFVIQPLRVLGIFVAHHQEVYCIYTKIGTCCAFQLAKYVSTKKHNMYRLYVYSIPPDDGLQICLKRVEVE